MKNSIKRAMSYLKYRKGKSILLVFLMIILSSVIIFSSVLNSTLVSYQESLDNKNGISISVRTQRGRPGESTTQVNELSASQISSVSQLDYVSDYVLSSTTLVSDSSLTMIEAATTQSETTDNTLSQNTPPGGMSNDMSGLKLSGSTNYDLDTSFNDGSITLSEGSQVSADDEIVISNELATLNELTLGDNLELSINSTNQTFKIVGLYDYVSDDDQFMQMMVMENTMYVNYDVISSSATQTNATYYISDIKDYEQFQKDYLSIGGYTSDNVNFSINDEVYTNTIKPLTSLVNAINQVKLIILAIILFLISIILIINTKERTYEIGVYYAIGEKKRNIIFQYLFENILLLSIAYLISSLIITLTNNSLINKIINLDIFTNMNQSAMMMGGKGGMPNVTSELISITSQIRASDLIINYLTIALITSIVASFIILKLLNKSSKDIINE